MPFLLAVIIVIGGIIWEKIDNIFLYPKRLEEMKEKERRCGVKWKE